MGKEAKIGLTVLAAIALVYITIAWTRTLGPFATSRRSFTVQFEHASGLKEGDPVMVLGTPAGNVEHIALGGGGVQVEVRVDEAVQLYSDAWAEIQIKELMGGKMIDVWPGKSGSALRAGSVIPGKTSLDFSTAFSRMGEFMDKVDKINLDTLFLNLNHLATVMREVADHIDPEDAGGLLHELRQTTGLVNEMLAKADHHNLVSKVDTALIHVNHLAGTADETMTAVIRLTERLDRETLPGADTLMREIRTMLDETESAMSSVKRLLAKMEDDKTLAGRLINDPELARDMDYTLDNLNKTLDHIRSKKIYVTMTLAKRQRKFDETVQEEK